MKRFSRRTALATSLGIAAMASASDDEVLYTNGEQNGRWWKAVGDNQVYVVIGIMKGVTACLGALDGSVIKKDAYEIAKTSLTTTKFTYGEVMQKITKLYESDPGNAIIPVSDMYRIALLGLLGDTPESVEKLSLNVRTDYVKQK